MAAKKIIWSMILIHMILLILPFTYAVETCEDILTPNLNCSMLTPSIICTGDYDYQIYAKNGSEVKADNLTLLNDTIYFLNFSQPSGDYIVRLCDESTREIKVKNEGESMIIGAIILLPVIFGIFLLIGAFSMNPQHSALKISLFLMSIICFWASLHLGLQSVIKFYDFPEFQETISLITWWTGLFFIMLVSYFCIYLIYVMFQYVAAKKQEKLNY